jgi:carboxypeptidase C (cathepsin A)
VNQGIALADRLQDAHLEIVEGGHMLPVTQPERVVQFVEDALKRSA